MKLLGITDDFVVPYGNRGWLLNTQQESLDEIEWYLSRSDNDLPRIKFLPI